MSDGLIVSVLLKLVDQFTKPMRGADDIIKRATESLEHYKQKSEAAFQAAANLMLASEGLKQVAEGARALTEVPIEKAMKLQTAIARLGYSARTGAAAFDQMAQTALNIAAGTEFSAAEVAQAAKVFTYGGVSVTDAMKQMAPVMAFASGHLMSLGEATGRVSTLLKSFGISATEAGYVTDVLTASAKAANAPVGDFSDSLARVAPIARGMGISLGSAASTLALMGRAGLSGERGAMALTAVLTRLGGSGRNSAATVGALKFLGIDALDAQKNLKDLPTVLSEIEEKTRGMGTAMRQRVFSVLFGRQAGASIGAMFQSMKPGDLEKLRASLEHVEGATEKVAARMDETAEQAKERLAGSLNSLQAALGMSLLPNLTRFYDKLSEVLGGITRWVTAHPRLVAAIMQTIQVVGALASALVVVISVMAGARAIQGILWLATGYASFARILSLLVIPAVKALGAALLAHPVVLIIVAIAAAIAALALAVRWVVQHWDRFVGMWERFKKASLSVKIAIGAMLAPIAAMAAPVIASLLPVLVPIAALGYAAYQVYKRWEPIKTWFVDLWDTVSGAVKRGVDAALRFIEPIVNHPIFKFLFGDGPQATVVDRKLTELGKGVAEVFAGPSEPTLDTGLKKFGGKIDINVNQQGRVTSVKAASDRSGVELNARGGLAWAGTP